MRTAALLAAAALLATACDDGAAPDVDDADEPVETEADAPEPDTDGEDAPEASDDTDERWAVWGDRDDLDATVAAVIDLLPADGLADYDPGPDGFAIDADAENIGIDGLYVDADRAVVSTDGAPSGQADLMWTVTAYRAGDADDAATIADTIAAFALSLEGTEMRGGPDGTAKIVQPQPGHTLVALLLRDGDLVLEITHSDNVSDDERAAVERANEARDTLNPDTT